MKRALLVTESAEADLRDIWAYSFQNWGALRADRYLDELDDGLGKCAAEPEGGERRDDVRRGYRSRLVRKHVVFYTFTEEEVLVQRVLHGSMDPTLHLPRDDSGR